MQKVVEAVVLEVLLRSVPGELADPVVVRVEVLPPVLEVSTLLGKDGLVVLVLLLLPVMVEAVAVPVLTVPQVLILMTPPVTEEMGCSPLSPAA